MTTINPADITTSETITNGQSPALEKEAIPHQQISNEWGIDPVVFDGLQRQEHRMFVLRVNMELITLLNNPRQNSIEYINMNSYERLIIHRVADHFQMDHVHDKYRLGVIVIKTDKSTHPSCNLQDIPGPLNVKDKSDSNPGSTEEIPSMKIIQRGKVKQDYNNRFNSHSNIGHVPDRSSNSSHQHNNGYKNNKPFKSYEEREAAYQQARARIFQENRSHENQVNSDDARTSSFQSNASHSTNNTNTNNGNNTNRTKNFVPRIQSAHPRPRYHHPQNYNRQNQQGYDNVSSTQPGSYGTYPVMYNPGMMPYMYQQPGAEVSQGQMAPISPGSIYVDPYTGAQYIIAMPEYYENGSTEANSASQNNEQHLNQKPQTDISKPSVDSVPSKNNSAKSTTTSSSNISNRISSLPLQFGSLSISETSKKDSSAVVFKNSKQQQLPKA